MQNMWSRGLVPAAKFIISDMLVSALTQQAWLGCAIKFTLFPLKPGQCLHLCVAYRIQVHVKHTEVQSTPRLCSTAAHKLECWRRCLAGHMNILQNFKCRSSSMAWVQLYQSNAGAMITSQAFTIVPINCTFFLTQKKKKVFCGFVFFSFITNGVKLFSLMSIWPSPRC